MDFLKAALLWLCLMSLYQTIFLYHLKSTQTGIEETPND